MGEVARKPLHSPTSETSHRGRRVIVAFVVLPLLAVSGLWVSRRVFTKTAPDNNVVCAGIPDDPRLSYAGPFLNLNPAVAYVGDQKCSECHKEKTLSYQQHPMGRSLLPIAQIAPQQRYDGQTNNPFESLGVMFRIDREGNHAVHRRIGLDDNGQTVYESNETVDYVLGSGTRGYSYLFNRDGYVFQSPVSWFSEKQIWDTSPGFSVQARAGRPVSGPCLFCHSNRVRPREGYINRYEEPLFDGYAIGCERCHGPGGLHVKDPGEKNASIGADYTIVNPRHLKPELRAAVCEQCHLPGEARVVRRGRDLFDFRPGLPLEAFWSIYVAAASVIEPRKAVNHVEQMYSSQCFVQSDERPGMPKLGCTSCHDPHRHIGAEERVAYYRERCLECHGQRGCSFPEKVKRLQGNDNSCIDCHMPRFPASDIAHTASTDHHIFRHASSDMPGANDPSKRETGIVPFYPPNHDLNQNEAKRDYGIALTHMMAERIVQRKPVPKGVGQQAVDLLEAALGNDPDDMQAREAKAEALVLLNRPVEALAEYYAVLSKAPDREASLMGTAMLAQDRRQLEAAVEYWGRAVAANPWQHYYRASLAKLLADKKDWNRALPECEAWVRLDPASIEARALLVSCLIKAGEKERARLEFTKIERLRPPNLTALQARFAVEMRPR
ncbi:MAG: tetratricopeptide repeat protein [Gemmataceae bacterium]